MSVSTQAMALHIRNVPPTPLSLRNDLGLIGSNVTLQVKEAPFSIMTQNMALVVRPAAYKGTNRDGAINELISRIRADPPDVVGLCEVFANGERDTIREGLSDIYREHLEGPDDANFDSDGGLLLLSKHPVSRSEPMVYNDCATPDCFASKGVLYMRVHHSSSMQFDVFFSHMQDIEASFLPEFVEDIVPPIRDKPRMALYSQLTQLGRIVQSLSDPVFPAFIAGDLNIPGENATHYDELLHRLGMPVDLWIAQGNTPASGFTNTTDNNFYADFDQIPKIDHRLDFVLMKAGSRFIPISRSVEILKWTLDGRQISDHFGLRADFEQMVQVDS